METDQELASLYPYRYEMHCHTCWCSGCGHSTPQEMAQAYFEAGYRGMVITDHFLLGNSCVDKTLPWEEMMKRYYDAYEAAREWAEAQEKPFTVLFGLEHQYGGGKEVLTYGIDLEFLVKHPDLHLYPLPEYVDAVHQAGGVVSMAHPYRHASYIDPSIGPRPECLDGAEVFNFYNQPEENEDAKKLAKKYDLFPTSGGDEHRSWGDAVGKAGLAFPKPVTTGAELVAALKGRDYKVVENGKLLK